MASFLIFAALWGVLAVPYVVIYGVILWGLATYAFRDRTKDK